MDRFLSKDDIRVMKAVAIILMFMHHLWEFPDRIAGGSLRYTFSIFGKSSIQYFGLFGKICVSIFFFLGGYGTYVSSLGKPYDIIGRLKKLYASYWKVFLIFIPIAFIFFRNQPIYCEKIVNCTRYRDFTKEEFFMNFFGIKTTYNGEWWFLKSYIIALITFPIIRCIADRFSTRNNVLIVIISSILMSNLFPALGKIEAIGHFNNNPLYSAFFMQSSPYITCFWMGVVAAENALLDRIYYEMIRHDLMNPIMDLFYLASIVFLRQTGLGEEFDFIYVPFMIVVCLDLVKRVYIIRDLLLLVGKQSTNMWLIHSFFCYYFYAAVKIVIAPRWAVVSLLVLIEMTYFASVGVEKFWGLVGSLTTLKKVLKL